MKKAILLLASVWMLVCMSQCSKPAQHIGDNHVSPILDGDKAINTKISFRIGHSSAGCPGCVPVGGSFVHVDCQGYGNQCMVSSKVTISLTSDGYVAMTTDTFGLTSEDFFNMPARSLSTGESGNNAYLNIPAQLVERDTATLQFTFTGLFYTGKPAYNNF